MNITPEQLLCKLKETVTGPDDYLKTLCVSTLTHRLSYDYFERTRQSTRCQKLNLLCLGQSDATIPAVKALGKVLDLPVLVEDASALKSQKWTNVNTTNSMAPRILDASNGNEIKARFCIVILDKFDLIFKYSMANKNNLFFPCEDLVKLVQGSTITYTDSDKTLSLNTSNLLFIFTGSFYSGYINNLNDIIKMRLSEDPDFERYTEIPEKNLLEFATIDDLIHYGCGIPWELLVKFSLVPVTNGLSNDQNVNSTQKTLIQQFKEIFYP